MNKIIFSSLLIIFFSLTLYSQNAVELNAYVNGGVTYTLPNGANMQYALDLGSTTTKFGYYEGRAGFDIMGNIQVGYYFDFLREFSGMSILLEGSFNYTRMGYLSVLTNNSTNSTDIRRVILDTDYLSAAAGAIIKFHFFKNFTFGIGGGVRFTFFDDNVRTTTIDGSNIGTTNDAVKTAPPALIIPYAKATIEYNLFITGNLTFKLGIYAMFDLGPFMTAANPINGRPMAMNLGASIGLGYLFRISDY